MLNQIANDFGCPLQLRIALKEYGIIYRIRVGRPRIHSGMKTSRIFYENRRFFVIIPKLRVI
jgi:hypothetical protein